MRSLVLLLAVLPVLVTAQVPPHAPARPLASDSAALHAADTTTVHDSTAADDADDDGAPLGLQFGVATGALRYTGGRQEQGLGVIARWAPRKWFALSVTPSSAHVTTPGAGLLVPATSSSGLTDLPVDATLSHAFGVRFAPTLSLGMGMSVPVGDTASGMGSGHTSFSMSTGLGLAPTEGVWLHLGAGKSLSGVSPQAAVMTGSGWGDVSAGTEIAPRLSVSAGFSSDLGAVDSTMGRSTSVEGGLGFEVQGHQTIHLTAGRGLSGAAPRWSVGLAFGTAFPYLNHLGAGSSLDALTQALGGGTHGLGSGKGSGSGSGSGSGRGRGKP